MQYIVLDMEWNQAWPGSSTARRLPSLHGEIIQIGAVRLLEDRTVADEFQILIEPHFIKKLHKKVSSLTGIKEAQLRAEGVPFAEAMERFRRWCGQDVVWLTWGFDDIPLLKENLEIHQQSTDWVGPWYNAQMFFNAQTDGSSNQRSLTTALEMLKIEPSRPAHDALGDAYHTALVCAKLDLVKGVAEYRKTVKAHENGFHGAELPGCLERQVFHGYADREAVMAAMGGAENRCPRCGQLMKVGKWKSQQGRRYMNLSDCPEHGSFLVRVRLQREEDQTLRVSRLVYAGDSEAAKAYERAAQKPHRSRSRRKSKKAAPARKTKPTE